MAELYINSKFRMKKLERREIRPKWPNHAVGYENEEKKLGVMVYERGKRVSWLR
jgi:hypothetical protein